MTERARGGAGDDRASKSRANAKSTPAAATRVPTAEEFRLSMLQAAAGNRATVGLLEAGQAKLEVGAADDALEHEADAAADAVVAHLQAGPPLPPPTGGGGGSPRRTARAASVDADGGTLDSGSEAAIARARIDGRALDEPVQRAMEDAFGADFGGVRVHDGSAAAELNAGLQARAFTLGNDVFFRDGAPDARSPDGQRLLAHELAHTVQQGASRAGVQRAHEPAARVGRRRGDRAVRRLMSLENFKTQTDRGRVVGRSETIADIENKLEAWHGWIYSTKYDTENGGLDRALNLVMDIDQIIGIWQVDHKGDDHSTARFKAMASVQTEARRETKILDDYRRNALGMPAAGAEGPLPEGVAEHKREKSKRLIKMEGTADTVFGRLGPVITALVPNVGDSASFEVAVNFPIGQGLGYIGMKLGFDCARADGNKGNATSVKLKASVTGGVKIPAVVKAEAELGVFIEAQGASPAKTLDMISWGFYQRVNNVLPQFAGAMWGGATGSVGKERSKRWAGVVEKEHFAGKENEGLASGVGSERVAGAYVRSGVLAGASAEAKLSEVVKGKAEAEARYGTHYDAKSIKDAQDKGEKRLGTDFLEIELGGEIKLGPWSLGVSGGLEWMAEDNGGFTDMTFAFGQIWLETAIAIPPPADKAVDQIVQRLQQLGPAMKPKINAALKKAEDKSRTKKGKAPRPDKAQADGNSAAAGVTEIDGTITQVMKGLIPVAEEEEAAEGATEAGGGEAATSEAGGGEAATSEGGAAETHKPPAPKDLHEQAQEKLKIEREPTAMVLKVGVGIERKPGKGIKGAVVTIDVIIEKKESVSVDVSLVAMSYERRRRVMRLRYDEGWRVD